MASPWKLTQLQAQILRTRSQPPGPTFPTYRTRSMQGGWTKFSGNGDGSSLDPVQVLAMPVTMVQQAVESIQQVKAIGQTEEDLKKKELILTIVGAVLAIVPFVGDAAAAAAGLASLARAITLIGEVANGAFSIYDIVGDPQSAPWPSLGCRWAEARCREMRIVLRRWGR
jgi:hypothetical protein